ncbi:hypothetical protein MA16_Dca014881 [Dendrobium catenatum]|uniref:Uncharacterized protein n=1 Tax=Dendrobium catenatum TaxID=906689 RepID=A0A2I0V6W0_9ASPA|nr:hypothetical protein MA16_Dca014881 [Dendrobium catenatum]
MDEGGRSSKDDRNTKNLLSTASPIMLDSKGRLSFKCISPFRILESPLILREGDLNARKKPLPISGKGKEVISSLNDKPNPLSAIISGANDKEASSSGGSFAEI